MGGVRGGRDGGQDVLGSEWSPGSLYILRKIRAGYDDALLLFPFFLSAPFPPLLFLHLLLCSFFYFSPSLFVLFAVTKLRAQPRSSGPLRVAVSWPPIARMRLGRAILVSLSAGASEHNEYGEQTD